MSFVAPTAVGGYPAQNYSRINYNESEHGIMLQPMSQNPMVVAVASSSPQLMNMVKVSHPLPQLQAVQVVQPRAAPNAEPVDLFPPFHIPAQLSDGKWKDDVCDCGNNLWPSCFCSFFCCGGMWLSAQMAHKTGFMTFRNALIAYAFAWIFALLLGISFLPSLFITGFTIFLRMHIAKKYQINQAPCCGECCCAFWCAPCSVAQMARHVYGYSKVLDGDADIDRPDGYGPIQNV